MTTTVTLNPFDIANNVNDFKNERLKFFQSFGDKHILCYNNNPKVKLSGMNHTTNIEEVMNSNVRNNSDAYFYVNGGRKKDDINMFMYNNITTFLHVVQTENVVKLFS